MTAKIIKMDAQSSGKHRLIMVAMKLFAERGFDGVTVRDLAKEAEVSIGLINHHFGSKDGLRRAVDNYFTKSVGDVFKRSAEIGVEQDPVAAGQFARDWIEEQKDVWPTFAAYLRRALIEGSDWGEHLFRRYYSYAQSLVSRYDAEGKVRPDVDRLPLTPLYLNMLLGTLLLDPIYQKILGRSFYEPDLWERHQRALNDLVWRGIGNDVGPRDDEK